ncbi:GDP-fucose protein O-fucosyltransferase 2-like [Palaemon carinicauda]|uniref:GDP-fucose protein O-fucosyltransferase 2-like n=1 Tax=Palaemon carinicauda TaxID=392227 RepID=UPI0035B5DEDD
MTSVKTIAILFLLQGLSALGNVDETCEIGASKDEKYLLYTVNPGEGFNLRRDVYLRIANLVRKLNEIDNWVLVLPPWGNFYHWKNTQRGKYFPWSSFFDLSSLNRWIPVMELSDFLKVKGVTVDAAYILQHYAEGWNGNWEEKYDERPCIEPIPFTQEDGSNQWVGRIWGTQISTENFSCMSVQGHASTIVPLVNKPGVRSVLVGRAETVLHDEFGGKWFWSARRSMRFANHLQEEANRFRKQFLDSDDARDLTEKKEDWRDSKPKQDAARGGPYVSVHLRRRDFIYAKGDEVPSLSKAAKQIEKLLKSYSLTKVFVATDASFDEIEELKLKLKEYEVHYYSPSQEFFNQWGDGGVAIVDQIICSYARIFIGSYESTFSFRIQEEREILGFPVETTFNRLCGKKKKCEQPAKWKIVY